MSTNDAHLMIVDDDERIRSLLKKFLMRAGFLVTAARDGAHARRLLTGLDFDLIIMDVMMPGEDGVSLTRALRETMTTPILLLTAKGETDDRIAGLEAGEVKLGAGRRQVVADIGGIGKKLGGHHRADRVASGILRAGVAVAVAEKARQRRH